MSELDMSTIHEYEYHDPETKHKKINLSRRQKKISSIIVSLENRNKLHHMARLNEGYNGIIKRLVAYDIKLNGNLI